MRTMQQAKPGDPRGSMGGEEAREKKTKLEERFSPVNTLNGTKRKTDWEPPGYTEYTERKPGEDSHKKLPNK